MVRALPPMPMTLATLMTPTTADRERRLHLRGEFEAARPLQGSPGEEYLVAANWLGRFL